MRKEIECIDYEYITICDTPGCENEEDTSNKIYVNRCPVCGADVCEKCSILIVGNANDIYNKVCSEECAGIYREWQDILQTKYDELDILFESRQRDFEKVTALKGE